MDSMITKYISRYQIQEEIGRGGMAVVYKAVDTTLESKVAIKIIMPGQQQTDRFLKRFIREAKTLAQLSHPNIVKILDFGDFEGSPYLVMEYIPGGSLSKKLGNPYSASEAAELLLPIASALHHAHQHQPKIIHRDVKPQNILINDAGQPILCDFGIAKLVNTNESQSLTGTGALVGTPSYMAPEQIKGGSVDARTDIYSLGVVFYEMVTGKKPYIANTPVEVTLKHLNDPIPKPRLIVRELPQAAEQVIYKSMAKNPDDRYADMRVFAAALEKISGKKYATPRSVQRKEVPSHKRNVRPMAYLSIGLALLVFGGFIFNSVSSGKMFQNVMAVAPTSTITVTSTITKPTLTLTASPEATNVPTATLHPTEAGTATLAPASSSRIIDSKNIANLIMVERAEKISVIKIDWTFDGKYVLDAGSKYLYILDSATLKNTGAIDLGNEITKELIVTADSKQVYVLLENSIHLFDLVTKETIKVYNAPGGTNSLALSSDGTLLALGISDNKVQLLRTSDSSVVRGFKSRFGGWSIAFSPDMSLIAEGTTNGVLMWEVGTGVWKPLKGEHDNLVKSLSFSNDGSFLAAGCDGEIILWNTVTGVDTVLKGDFKTVNSIAFSPDGKLLVTGNEDSTVRVYDVGVAKLTELKILKGHTSSVYSVHFSPDGEKIVSGANEGVIMLWGLP